MLRVPGEVQGGVAGERWDAGVGKRRRSAENLVTNVAHTVAVLTRNVQLIPNAISQVFLDQIVGEHFGRAQRHHERYRGGSPTRLRLALKAGRPCNSHATRNIREI